MKRLILIVLFCLGVAVPSIAGAQCPGIDQFTGIRPVAGHEQIAVSATAVALTVPTAFVVRFALVSVQDNAIRTLDTGTAPTASFGLLWQPNEKIYVCQSSLAAFRAIRQTADAVIDVSYFGN